MSQVWSEWWVWAVAGLVLAILEVVVPGWIFLGFAVGAGAVALILGVGGPLAAAMSGSIALLLVVFAVLSVVAWLVMRKVFGLRGGGAVRTFDHDINEN